jgi:hypothetical protein
MIRPLLRPSIRFGTTLTPSPQKPTGTHNSDADQQQAIAASPVVQHTSTLPPTLAERSKRPGWMILGLATLALVFSPIAARDMKTSEKMHDRERLLKTAISSLENPLLSKLNDPLDNATRDIAAILKTIETSRLSKAEKSAMDRVLNDFKSLYATGKVSRGSEIVELNSAAMERILKDPSADASLKVMNLAELLSEYYKERDYTFQKYFVSAAKKDYDRSRLGPFGLFLSIVKPSTP